MIDDVVDALNGRTWPDYVHGQLGPRVGERLGPSLRPVVGAIVEPPGEVPVGGSKVGGLPHVDGTFSWPTEDDSDDPLALVCQINLAEAGLATSLLPKQGMLYLFSIYDSDRAYGYEIDETTSRVLHVPDPGPLRAAVPPIGLGEDGVLPERRLMMAPSLIAEWFDDESGGYHEQRYDYEVERALDEAMVAHGGAPCGVVRMLGHAHLFREETRELIDEDAEGLLLYVNGWAVGRYAFGEGEFHVVIGHDDLAAGHLDRATVLFEPGT